MKIRTYGDVCEQKALGHIDDGISANYKFCLEAREMIPQLARRLELAIMVLETMKNDLNSKYVELVIDQLEEKPHNFIYDKGPNESVQDN